MKKITVVKTLPKQMFVAFSGGADSVVMAHTARQRGIDVTLAFFNHNNGYSEIEEEFVSNYAGKNNYKLVIEKCSKIQNGSKEKFWRDSRYEWFRSLNVDVATGHNLDDAVEWYLMTSLQGEGHFIPYNHSNVIRPLLVTTKKQILDYAVCYNLNWLNDPSNEDISFTVRNKIRKELVPFVREISPGLFNIVKKKIQLKTHCC